MVEGIHQTPMGLVSHTELLLPLPIDQSRLIRPDSFSSYLGDLSNLELIAGLP